MANRNWTRGEAEALVHVADKPHQEQRDFVWASVKVGGIEVHDSDGMYCDKPSEFEGSEEHANAALIADAFNVAHRTGRTPSELTALIRWSRSVVKLAQTWLVNSVPVVEIDEPKPLPIIAALLAELDSKMEERVATNCPRCEGPLYSAISWDGKSGPPFCPACGGFIDKTDDAKPKEGQS